MHPIYEQNATKIGERYQPKIISRCTHDDLKTDTDRHHSILLHNMILHVSSVIKLLVLSIKSIWPLFK